MCHKSFLTAIGLQIEFDKFRNYISLGNHRDYTALKTSVFGVFLVRIFPHWD